MKAAHRHSASGHEHEFEPQRGLPETLPGDEKLLWQGSPDWRMLARRAFHLRKLALYFAALVLMRAVFVFNDTASALAALRSTLGPLALAGVALGLVALMAWLSARSTVYTLTDKRVVLRIGIVLTLTFNIPTGASPRPGCTSTRAAPATCRCRCCRRTTSPTCTCGRMPARGGWRGRSRCCAVCPTPPGWPGC